MYGTAGAAAPDNDATADWEAAFIAEYGELPVLAYVKRPMTRPSRSPSPHRRRAASTARLFGIICERSAVHPARLSWARPRA